MKIKFIQFLILFSLFPQTILSASVLRDTIIVDTPMMEIVTPNAYCIVSSYINCSYKHGLIIHADSVIVDGINKKNGFFAFSETGGAGIIIHGTGVEIKNLKIGSGFYEGIYLSSDGNYIHDNEIVGCRDSGTNFTSSNQIVENNIFDSNGMAIVPHFGSKNNRILKNIIDNNQVGIYILNSDSNIVSFNKTNKINKRWGIAVVQSYGNVGSDNNVLGTDKNSLGCQDNYNNIQNASTEVQLADNIFLNQYFVFQNYPNPFNTTTTIKFFIPTDGELTIEIYNLLGEKVKTLLDKKVTAGINLIRWDGKNCNGIPLPSGQYLCRVQLPNGEIFNKRMILLK